MKHAGEGKHRVWLTSHEVGHDLIYHLGGGHLPHVGGVVLKVPGEKLQTLTFGSHHDLEVLSPIAEAACAKHGRLVVVTGGVHVDDATSQDIELLVANCRELIEQL